MANLTFEPISAGIDLVKTFANKFLRDKMSEEDQKKLELEAEAFVMKEARKVDSSFRQFVVEYEGAAKDVPRVIVVFRALIRPAFTVLVGYLDYLFFTGATSAWDPEAIALLKSVNIIVLMFWFGERAVVNSGIIDKLLNRKQSS